MSRSRAAIEVALKNSATSQFSIWNTDSNGNFQSSSDYAGNSTALKSLETSFHQDLNGDGVIGIPGTVIFPGLHTAYTLTALSSTSVQVVVPGGTETLINVEKLVFDDTTLNWPPPRDDFDEDGHSDVLWQNSNGAISIWDSGRFSGAHTATSAGTVPSTWHIVATGDFDGNAHERHSLAE